jgi:PAS domain-containing protein
VRPTRAATKRTEPLLGISLQSYEFTERLTDFTALSADCDGGLTNGGVLGRDRMTSRDCERSFRRITSRLFERMWLASIVEFSDDAIMSKNLDGIITSWNKGAERLYGYLGEEAIGDPVTILIPPERQYEEGTILKLIRRGERLSIMKPFASARMERWSIFRCPSRLSGVPEGRSSPLQWLPVTLPSASGSRCNFPSPAR